MIFYMKLAVREHEVIELGAVIVGHRCHVVKDCLIRLGLDIRNLLAEICNDIASADDTAPVSLSDF